ncbi:MAG TPA: prepilin peptidase [Clostridiales bacterium]|nr:prepilin peptidase [Clostridiales bacterium]
MYILIFILGIMIGSFLNKHIYKILRKESIQFSELYCIHCSNPLKLYNLTSIFSYIFHKRKCRYFGKQISLLYLMVEFINGLTYLVLFHYFGLSLKFIYFSLIISILIVISIIDYFHQIIPNYLLFIMIITIVLYKIIDFIIYGTPAISLDGIIGFFAAGLSFTIIALISNGGMGGGDIKLIAILGFILGLKKIILNIILSFIIGAIISLFLLLSRKKERKDTIPFGPFINISFIISLLWGESIIKLYINKFM